MIPNTVKYVADQFELPLNPMDRKPSKRWRRDIETVGFQTRRWSAEPEYVIYTDGSCFPNPGPGGWCAILFLDGKRINTISSGSPLTTNNQMELCAVVNGLMLTPKGSRVTVVTDSQYVQRGATLWCESWSRKGFIGVKNAIQWHLLWGLKQERDCDVKWIRGHNGDALNEECDRLAEKERMKIK